MINIVDGKYCGDKNLQVMWHTDYTHLVLSDDGEIVLLKNGENVLINKYVDHKDRFSFPYSDSERVDEKSFTEIFDYNKLYISYIASRNNVRLFSNYFYKGKNRAIACTDSLLTDRFQRNESSFTREEIEKYFDSYDSLFIVDEDGNIKYIRSLNEGISIGNLLPTEEQIIEIDIDNREFYANMAYYFGNQEEPNMIMPRSIEDIKDVDIYRTRMLGDYRYILIGIKNGKLELKWFGLTLESYNNYKFSYKNINVPSYNVDDLYYTLTNEEVKFLPEPTIKLIKK